VQRLWLRSLGSAARPRGACSSTSWWCRRDLAWAHHTPWGEGAWPWGGFAAGWATWGHPTAAPRAPHRLRWRKQPPCPSPNPRRMEWCCRRRALRQTLGAWSGAAAAVSQPASRFRLPAASFLRLFSLPWKNRDREGGLGIRSLATEGAWVRGGGRGGEGVRSLASYFLSHPSDLM
jgi:hypothetical protein